MISGSRHLDWGIIGGLVIISMASLVSLASANIDFFWRQLIWYGIGFSIILFGSSFDWRWIGSQRWFRYGLYWVSLLFIIYSNLQGGTVRGVKSWISIAGVQFEPGELVKLALIFIFADFFARRHIHAWQAKNLLLSFFYAAIPAALIAIHPDMGSAFIVMSFWFGYMLMSGVHLKRFLLGVGVLFCGAVLMWSFFLKPYQKARISSFISPERDPLGISYNVIQAKVAIGSAGFWGKGFKMGTQTQLHFLPESKTDFIFAAFVEEWGLFGGAVLLLTFLFIVYRVILIGQRARDNYFKLISLGGGLFFIVHFFVNVGSNLGLLPVTGVTFPFMSFGGSNLLTSSIILSVIQHIKLESSA
ncbi:MAG: FtsW/RodA/SpoVE family cell cycle protein [Candidatus Jorgensenbacteria bacterium]|nr:FtsW/RodA/SpoVE family cell cycle protein [Candidatus Jorgensenbacteria bacterium]